MKGINFDDIGIMPTTDTDFQKKSLLHRTHGSNCLHQRRFNPLLRIGYFEIITSFSISRQHGKNSRKILVKF